jgi:hypothetical protein
MSDKLFVPIVFVVVALFAVMFKDAFVATSNFIDETRCSIGWEAYCEKVE